MNVRLGLRIAALLGVVSSLAAAGETKPGTSPIPATPPPGSPGSKGASALIRPAAPPANVAVKWSTSTAFENRMQDAMDVAASAPLTGQALLGGFRVRFNNGDHKLRKIGVTAKDRYANFTLADSNGDDPFAGIASWAVLPTGKISTVSATGGGQFEIPIPDKVPGHKLVLSGFEFRRQDGTDANVRSIGVWLDGERSTARVMLMDDQGPDFRGFERTIGMALLAGPGFGEMKFGTDGILAAVNKVNRGEANGRYRPFAVTVQYAWVPDHVFSGTDTFSGTSRSPSSGKIFPTNGVLQGFEFFFGNADHYLLDVGVMPPIMRTPGGALQTPPGESVAYQDRNRDDPMRWGAQFAILKPSSN